MAAQSKAGVATGIGVGAESTEMGSGLSRPARSLNKNIKNTMAAPKTVTRRCIYVRLEILWLLTCPRKESNLRPSAPEADALSTELRGQFTCRLRLYQCLPVPIVLSGRRHLPRCARCTSTVELSLQDTGVRNQAN